MRTYSLKVCKTCEYESRGWSYPTCNECSGEASRYSNWAVKTNKPEPAAEPKPKIVKPTGRLVYLDNGYHTFDCKTCGLPIDGNIFCSEACRSVSLKKLASAVKDIKDKGCYICGYNKCHNALAFHHLEDKNKTVSMMKYYHELVYEIETCCMVILCSNCHSEVHSKISTDICLGWLTQ
jgi:hypothetical protein